MDERFINMDVFAEVREISKRMMINSEYKENLKHLKELLEKMSSSNVKIFEAALRAVLYSILKKNSDDKKHFSNKEKHIIIDIIQEFWAKSVINMSAMFYTIYSFLLSELADQTGVKVLPIAEEYKYSIMCCMETIFKALSEDLIFTIYEKKNAPILSQMLYISIELAKTEKLKPLRIAAIQCIMQMARISNDEDFGDIEVRKQVADIFLFFLPGVASGLAKIAIEDEKIGHKIPVVALKAWGRIVTLLMQDYNAVITTSYISKSKIELALLDKKKSAKKKWVNDKEMTDYIENTKISWEWYCESDKKLQQLVIELTKLTHHSHHKVRLELTELCAVIINNCLSTMPLSSSRLIGIVITLSEDEDLEIRTRSHQILENLSHSLPLFNFKTLLESLEEGFIRGVHSLIRKFNGIDEEEQLASLNHLIGYINLFGKHNLHHVLLSANHLNIFLMTLIHISELQKSSTGLFEEYSIKDFEVPNSSETPWKKFTHFKNELIIDKIEKLCSLLGQFETFRMVSDFLLDIIISNESHRKEAIFILNAVSRGVVVNENNIDVLKSIIETYIENQYCQIPVRVTVDEYGDTLSLAQVQHNAIQICLVVEGIGKMALILHEHFNNVMLKIIYLVLEKAGSTHSLVRSAGLSALKDITIALGYSDITQLIIRNVDYFTFHVERRIKRADDKEGVMAVLSVVLQYSTLDVLPLLAYTIEEVLFCSCDKFKEVNINLFLEVFQVFISSLRRWLKITIREELFKSKADKEKEYEAFKLTGLNEITNEFSDDIMGKTAEEMYEEDKNKKLEELENEVNNQFEVPEHKKPDLPLEIKLTVAILTRSLNFLPSKDRSRKLLVLRILSDGLHIIRDWEDELLPIVHKIWSPLVQRFKEYNEPVIINYSFQLLAVLAQLSKEFIRLRTVKEVLPSILELMEKYSKDSYLKDKGSAYRYSQAYKLQVTILENLAKVVIHLDIDEANMKKVINCLYLYLSDRQPVPLQVAATECLKLLSRFDPETTSKLVSACEHKEQNHFEKNLNEVTSFISKINVN